MSVGHVAGPVAEAALDALVGQFADRTSFVRELVQNSLDAGSGRVDVAFELESGTLTIEVFDDGEGMDRAIIESCLLTLFRSSKERDLTKIGKFGIGFVSLFALNPERVVVDTARDGEHHRVVFAKDRTFTLMEVDSPFEGTRVRIETRLKGKDARKLVRATDKALAYWCRFARADIWSRCDHAEWGWADREVTGEFTVDAPILHIEQADSFRAVLGPSGTDPSRVAFHNRGLTLLEADESLIPGVTFRVEAAALEHTLTRDNVLRDGAFDDVIARLRKLAEGPLRQAWLDALVASCAPLDPDRRQALLACAHPPIFVVPSDLPYLPTVTGDLVSRDALKPRGVLAWTRRALGALPTVYCAESSSPLTEAAARAGMIVLLGSAESLRALAAETGTTLEALSENHRVAVPTDDTTPLLDALVALADRLYGLKVHPARFDPPLDRLTDRQKVPGQLRTGREPDPTGQLLLHIDHPLFSDLAPLPADVAAPILLRAICAEVESKPLTDDLVDTLAAALSRPEPEVSPDRAPEPA